MNESSNPALTIVLPCYNPIEGWDRTVIESYQKIEKMLPKTDIQLILVNDGSKRGVGPHTFDVIQAAIPSIRIISYQTNRGKGYALRQGVQEVNTALCIYTDIDFPYIEQSLVEVYEHLKAGNDIVAGVRDQTYYAKVPKTRIFISKFLKSLIKALLKIKITDTQAGLKGFSMKGKEIFLQTQIDRYLFDLEFIYLGSKQSSLQLLAHPVRLKPGIQFSTMNWKILLTEARNFLKVVFS